MILAGQAEGETTKSVEIIDLKTHNLTCPHFLPLPKGIYGAFGGLIFDDKFLEKPLICGGNIGNTVQDKCYAMNDNGLWISLTNLNLSISYTNAVESPFTDGGLFAAAGFSGKPESSAQEFRNSDWMVSEQQLPVKMWLHCTIKLDETTVMVTGGVQGTATFSDKTFMLNASLANVWTRGKMAFLLMGFKFH